MIPDRFRWVYCQLDTLRRCMPSSIRKSLNELPITLDDTYERILQCIPKEKFQHARRLFQCIVAAIRPLRVEELAEIFAIEFDTNEVTNLVEGWRPENAEEAVLSACSSLIAIIDDRGSKIVHFSQFSVKEYMTSDRLQRSDIGHLCDYYIPLEPAHTILARACMAVLLQLDEKVDRERVATFPLGQYASRHWLDHTKLENVQSQIQDDLKHLFDPKRPHLRACIWMHNVEIELLESGYQSILKDYSDAERPPPLPGTPLYYAVLCGFSELAKWLVTTQAEDVNAKCHDDRTPLHVASQKGHVDAVHVLLDHGAHVNAQERYMSWTPLHFASEGGNLKVVQLLLEHEATLNARSKSGNTPVYLASREGRLEVVRLLLSHGADVHIWGQYAGTRGIPFQIATANGHHDIAQLLLEHGPNREREGSRDSIVHM
jgi:ankyrin repeat protein